MRSPFFLLFAITSIVTACSDTTNLDSLLKNPKKFETAISECQNDSHRYSNDNQQCREIMNLAQQFMTSFNERQADPQAFGEKILQCEREIVELKAKISTLKANLTGDPQQLEIKSELENSELLFQQKQQQLSVLLAVVGMSRPD